MRPDELRMVIVVSFSVLIGACATSSDDGVPEQADALDVGEEPDATDATGAFYEQCIAFYECADAWTGAVCEVSEPTRVFQNRCFFYCERGTWQGTAPLDDAACVLPGCPFPDCPPEWSSLGPVCVAVAPGYHVSFANPYDACCAPGHYRWLSDTRLTPGLCPQPGACGAGCPSDVGPVCGTSADGPTKTYANACFLASCEASLECRAPCIDTANCPQCAAQSDCAPICGADGHTYRNICYAECLGGTKPEYSGVCCDCEPASPDTLYCGQDGTTFGNLCWLDCKQGAPAYRGPCVDGCAESPSDPAAGTCGFYQGQFTKFTNASCATLAGATCLYDGACVPGTNPCSKTSQEYAPVCATPSGSAAPKTFANLCHAGCAAADVHSSGVCPECDVLCPAGSVDPTPTCGPDCVLYPNDCVATTCAGFDPSELTKTACPASCTSSP